MDAGLPGWTDLLRTLLEDGFRREQRRLKSLGMGLPAATYEELASEVLDAGDVNQAGTVVRLLLDERRDHAISDALYDEHGYAVEPGPVLHSIARLGHTFPGRCRFLTFNYDNLLEKAIVAPEVRAPGEVSAPSRDAKSLPKLTEGVFPVVHLHGCIPQGGEPDGHIVLDETDYVESVSARKLLDRVLSDRTPTLLVGLSMTDRNLVSSLLRQQDRLSQASGTRRDTRFGLFVQSSGSPRASLAYRERIRSLGVRPVDLVSYAQVAQILQEVALNRILGSDEYWSNHRYGLRFERWVTAFGDAYPMASSDDFRDSQRRIHDALRNELEGLCSPVAEDALLRAKRPDEHLGMELWLRFPATSGLGEIRRWASTVTELRESWLVEERSAPIERDSRVIAATSIYSGTTEISDYSKQPGARWQAAISVPIVGSNPPHYHLPVGAVVLLSTNRMGESILGEVNTSAGSASALRSYLRDAGRKIALDLP